jgi:hypothetical protein
MAVADLIELIEHHPQELRRRVAAMPARERARLADFAARLAALVAAAPQPSERADWLMAN